MPWLRADPGPARSTLQLLHLGSQRYSLGLPWLGICRLRGPAPNAALLLDWPARGCGAPAAPRPPLALQRWLAQCLARLLSVASADVLTKTVPLRAGAGSAPAPPPQVANADFFLKMVPLFDAGDDVGMVLSPQAFHNIDVRCDVFNHSNVQFWEYAQPGYDAIPFISCTGAAPAGPAAHALHCSAACALAGACW